MRVQSLGQEDPLEEEMGNPLQYSCLKKIPWTEVWYSSKGFEEMDVIEHHC